MTHTLTTYKEFRPTAFDSAGAFLPDRQDWYVAPVSQTRDSGPLDQSNFQTFTALLTDRVGPEGATWEIHRFGHWGPGWFEVVIVQPGTAAFDAAVDAATSLLDYPVLDENDWCEREDAEAQARWTDMDVPERVEVMHRGEQDASIFAARRDDLPCGVYYADIAD
jgi:hypothetical protein